MFKKRTIKQTSNKRKREELSDNEEFKDGDNGASSLVADKKEDKEDKEDKENKEDIEGKEDDKLPSTKAEFIKRSKLASSQKLLSSDEKDRLFNPDLLVKEQHDKLSKDISNFRESKKIQKIDSDGSKLYTGLISNKSEKDAIVKPASIHVKRNYIMDFEKDVCKDFLKNGYCGFGDTCKFLHYRDEFKLNDNRNKLKDWEQVAKKYKKF